MEFDHGTLVWFSKSFGLFYLIGPVVPGGGLRLLAVEQGAVRPGGTVHHS